MESVEHLLKDENELLDLAEGLAKYLSPGLVLYLQGNLGAGKTVFARGLLHGLGHKGLVKSPTYSLVEPYTIDDATVCYHFDLYRLTHPEELEFTGSRDYFNEQSLCLVEWPEKATGFIPLADIVCDIHYHESGRKITISASSDKGEKLMLQYVSN